MLASRWMRAVRELSLAAPLLLVGLALYFGGGPADGSVSWLGGLALLSALVLLARRGLPGGTLSVVPLGALALWCAVSISWSWLPDRSWDYANRTAVYALAALLGLWAAERTGELAEGLAVLLGSVVAYSLLGKVLPVLYDYGGPDVTRLRGPIGLWNQLALAADFTLVLALALRRRGVLPAYVALVALLLTYSRGGVVTAVFLLAAFFALDDERIEAAAAFFAALVPAAVVVAVAFVLPGITSNDQSSHVRWRDGVAFGVVVLAGAAAALVLSKRPQLRDARIVRWAGASLATATVAAGVVLVVVHGIGSGTVGNGGGRFASTSSNFRFTWWEQAWRGFRHHVLDGTGAGSFKLVNLLYRKTYLDETIEPHNLPLQFLSELGLVGLVLLAAALFFLLRRGVGRRGGELALALLLPAFVVHSLVDVDWDFAAVAIPAFVAAGAITGGAARRVDTSTLLPAGGIAILLAGALFSPWLARRWANQAYFATSPAHAISLSNRAHALDPLLLDPYWTKAIALNARGERQKAFDEYVAATKRQPHNPLAWYYAGRDAWDQGCPYLAYDYLEPYTERDPKGRPSQGGALYNEALRRVNNRQYHC